MRTLLLAPSHGQGISRSIQQQSEDVFLVDHGSLYLALQRLEAKDYVRGEWGVSENNRRAKYYRLTTAGKKQLQAETEHWGRMSMAISRILERA